MSLTLPHARLSDFAACYTLIAFLLLPSSVLGQSSRRGDGSISGSVQRGSRNVMRAGGDITGSVQRGSRNVMDSNGDIVGNVQIGDVHVLRSPGSVRNNIQIRSSAPIPVRREYKAGDTVVVMKDAALKIDTKTVATARKGEKLTVQNVEGDWIGVSRGDVSGWVENTYVFGPITSVKTAENADAGLGDKYTVSLKYYMITSARTALVRKLRHDFGMGDGSKRNAEAGRPSPPKPPEPPRGLQPPTPPDAPEPPKPPEASRYSAGGTFAKAREESERSRRESEEKHRQQLEEHRREVEWHKEQVEAMKAKLEVLKQKLRDAKDAETRREIAEEMRQVTSSSPDKTRNSAGATFAEKFGELVAGSKRPKPPEASRSPAQESAPRVQEKTPRSTKGRIEAFESETPNLHGEFVVDTGVRSGEMLRLANRDFAMQCELTTDSGSDSNVVLWLVLKELGGDSSPLVIEFPPQTLVLGRPAVQADMNLGPTPSGYACIVEVNK